MRDAVARDLSWSARMFTGVVWPAIQAWCGGGSLTPVESSDDAGMRHNLDVLAGIDAWQIIAGRGMRGIASRIQRGRCWNTFTIRMSRASGEETEWKKRLRALDEMERCWLLPFLTVQAYVDDPSGLNGVGVVRTLDLFATARKAWAHGGSHGEVWLRRNACGDGDADFLAVDWAWLRAKGVAVKYMPERGQEP